MSANDAATGRTWTDPAWGESVHLVPAYWTELLDEERLNHLGVMIAFWTGVCLIVATFRPVIDYLFGLATFDRSIGALLRSAPQGIAICFLGGTALALLVKLAQRFGYFERAFAERRAQAELFTNGVYAVGHGFSGGAPPFIAWRRLDYVDLRSGRWGIKLTIMAQGRDAPLVLKLTPRQAAAMTAAMEPVDAARGPPLFMALRETGQANRQGRASQELAADADTSEQRR